MKYKCMILLLVVGSVFIASAQDKGIHFIKNIDWQEILTRAKTEHKYIMIDCYATWCGPCKQMDAEVYPLEAIGNIYNSQFICLKVQMDKTPKDSEESRNQYGFSEDLAKTYQVNAYPTFLFFDQDGKPVHKVVGSCDADGFLQLAKDALNSQKQYYRVLADFKPGQLDTAEEKELAITFSQSDTNLADRMAEDFFNRIPASALRSKDNLVLMLRFQSDSLILQKALSYLNSVPKEQLARKMNHGFMTDLLRQPKVHQFAVNYITSLTNTELSDSLNLDLASNLSDDLSVRKTAKKYIENLTPNQRLVKKNILLVSNFTLSPSDPGFAFFYDHANEIDRVMQDNDFAQGQIEYDLLNIKFKPQLENIKTGGPDPDFNLLFKDVNKQYGEFYAKRVQSSAELSFYQYLVLKKHKAEYWPQLFHARIVRTNLVKSDTLKSQSNTYNNICYNLFFLHCNDHAQLRSAITWMRQITDMNPENFGFWDTYACLLYKLGDTRSALAAETEALNLAKAENSKDEMELFPKTIARMKSGEHIWEEKEYQN